MPGRAVSRAGGEYAGERFRLKIPVVDSGQAGGRRTEAAGYCCLSPASLKQKSKFPLPGVHGRKEEKVALCPGSLKNNHAQRHGKSWSELVHFTGFSDALVGRN